MIDRIPNPVKRDGIIIFLDIGQSPASEGAVSDYFLLTLAHLSLRVSPNNPFTITTTFRSLLSTSRLSP